ncbi:tetratricopeptide repeat protein [Mucilaginibacter angelicae]|uniref:Tetratricopeptide repeat protein n=1 Tax=Mucilaginibacter angelicae TaxID=869718 RepID=A0ABV6LH20_9SPHI
MKHLFLITAFYFIVGSAFSQAANTGIDTSLKFNQRYTKCEKKWVVLSKKDTASYYLFGFIYIDSQAGFTFDLQGSFKVNSDNQYITDPKPKDHSLKLRIIPNWQLVALLPEKHFSELGIKPEPDWIKGYYAYTDTVRHNYRWGWIYNDQGEPAIALTYLEPAYRSNPHTPGLEFEIAYAYNALNQYDAAIKILEPAIQNKPDNMFFYKELGYAYYHKKAYKQAIDTYKTGLGYADNKKSEAKGELAFILANAYKSTGNENEYKNWMIKGKEYTPPESPLYKNFIDAGF